mmetsp:Transcript_9075/g.29825  ORF Transcript_9075/g.29825 Transcript_9075/m.29825 type:complete len:303 (+) Transcript_9075:736-1644(+)
MGLLQAGGLARDGANRRRTVLGQGVHELPRSLHQRLAAKAQVRQPHRGIGLHGVPPRQLRRLRPQGVQTNGQVLRGIDGGRRDGGVVGAKNDAESPSGATHRPDAHRRHLRRPVLPLYPSRAFDEAKHKNQCLFLRLRKLLFDVPLVREGGSFARRGPVRAARRAHSSHARGVRGNHGVIFCDVGQVWVAGSGGDATAVQHFLPHRKLHHGQAHIPLHRGRRAHAVRLRGGAALAPAPVGQDGRPARGGRRGVARGQGRCRPKSARRLRRHRRNQTRSEGGATADASLQTPSLPNQSLLSRC